MARGKIAEWLYSVASVLCFINAVTPAFKGGKLDVVLLACGVVFLILAATVRRKTPPSSHSVAADGQFEERSPLTLRPDFGPGPV